MLKLKKSLKYSFLYFITLFFLSLLLVFFSRMILPTEIDDVSPSINCSQELLDKSDVLWVIPNFENKTITKEWCKEILSLNKELGMHGIKHKYNEFSYNISEQELLAGMEIFKDCFGYYPTRFKPPQLNISKENKKLIKKYMELEGKPNQLFHKVYHCEDTGIFSNRLIDLF